MFLVTHCKYKITHKHENKPTINWYNIIGKILKIYDQKLYNIKYLVGY